MIKTVKQDLITLVQTLSQSIELPAIKRIYLPEPQMGPDRHTEFGVIVLDDGAAGLYYAWLGSEGQKGMANRFELDSMLGQNPVCLLEYFDNQNEAESSLGLAAINAITQSLFRQHHYVPDTAANSMGALEITDDDHIGMVGYFPSLVKRLSEQGVRLTVIEKKSQFAEQGERLNVTPDLEALTGCNKVMITASTLLNDSIDEALSMTKMAQTVVVMGPSAGFFPDPLFERGVTAVGGSGILDADIMIERLKNNQGLGDMATKYLIKRAEYPGTKTLAGIT